jgi:molecular chaperone GrpE (heat shock protein)
MKMNWFWNFHNPRDNRQKSIPPHVPSNGRGIQILGGIKSALYSILMTLKGLDQKVSQLLQHSQQDNPPPARYLQTVADCQKQTAEVANGQMERHALYPAVEAVNELTNIILNVSKQAKSLTGNQPTCQLYQPLFDSIAESAKLAEATRDRLDMVVLAPDPLSDLDSKLHEIKQATPTDDPNKHGKVAQTLVAGLFYRGKVVRKAAVSIYRYTVLPAPNNNTNS